MRARPLTSRRQYLLACLVGIGSGLLAVAFRAILEWMRSGRDLLGPLGLVALAVVGSVASVAMVRRVPEISGSGIPYLKEVVQGLKVLLWPRVLPTKFLGGLFGIGSGLALGREGPTVQMGGSVGQLVSECFRSNEGERRELVAAGAGAGLAAAFNAPLSGMVFVLEELHANFTSGVFVCTLVAAASADVVMRACLGQEPAFHLPQVDTPPLNWLPGFVLLGLTSGVGGVVYNRVLLATLALFQKGLGRLSWIGALLAGLLAGLSAAWKPVAAGDGDSLMRALFGEVDFAMGTLLALFGVRFVISMTSYGCGAPGGLFAPLLVLGALHGFVFAGLTGLDAQACAVVAMAAYFTAIVRAPLTGVVLITEMTLNYNLMLPLLLACAAASMVCELTKSPPIYDALEELDTLAIDLIVRPGAPWIGSKVDDLDLPEGVECRDEVLRAGSKLVVSMRAAQDETILASLREGCGFSKISEPAATVDGTNS